MFVRSGWQLRHVTTAVAVTIATVLALPAGQAHAAYIYPTSAVGSSSYPGYPDSDAIDTGANKFISDWASDSQGAGSYLDLSFSQTENFTSVFLTDRTTSGGSNNGFVGGLYDYATEFSIQAYTDGTFSTPVGSPLVFSKPDPASTSSVADFQVTEDLGGLTGQYLRYTVLASNGVNPGLADIEFGVAAPEPTSLALMGAALLGFGATRRKRC